MLLRFEPTRDGFSCAATAAAKRGADRFDWRGVSLFLAAGGLGFDSGTAAGSGRRWPRSFSRASREPT
ncbi:MAG: hypothetical protein R3F11_17985 [Verrucomicrobiales bacterium]